MAASSSVVSCGGKQIGSLLQKQPRGNQLSLPKGPQRINPQCGGSVSGWLVIQVMEQWVDQAPQRQRFLSHGPAAWLCSNSQSVHLLEEPGIQACIKRRHHVLPCFYGVLATVFCLGLPDISPCAGATCKRDCSLGKLKTKP